MAGRNALERVKEVLTQGFADFYDAFADMDADRDGKVSLQDFQQAIQNLEGGEDLSRDQIDSTFNKCGVDDDGFIVLKGLLAAFMGTASRSATDTGGISANIISRAFEEVLMECKDAEGVQKFITVPSTMGWTDLLQKLKHKYGRAVTFMYEADGHSYSVKDEMDFKLCWDSVEEAFLKTSPITQSAHLVAFIINLDPSKIKSSSHTGGVRASRKSLLAPKRVTLGQVQDDAGHAESVARRQAQKEAFEAKNEWIDNMMRKTGVSDAEPSSMRKKGWDKLLKACHELDTRREKTMNIDMFKKALQRVDPSITDDQMAWYVKDAKRTAAAGKGSDDVFYEKYCELKKTGKSVSELQGMDDDTVRGFEMQIRSAMKDRYRTIQAAFKRFDEDKDGFIHKKEFRDGIENKLKIKLQQRILDEIFKKADTKDDDKLDYEEFLEYFRALPDAFKKDADGSFDSLTNIDLCKVIVQAFNGLGNVFTEMDIDGDGQVSRQEFHEGLRKMGIKLSFKRMADLMNDFLGDTNSNVVDYHKFLTFTSKFSLGDVSGSGTDDVAREEARVRDKIREHYRDAKEAFHDFNKNTDGRLSQEEFFRGIDQVFGNETITQAMKNRLMQRADMDGDGFLSYHEFLGRFGVKASMRQSLALQQKICFELQRKFPDSLQKAFDQLDHNKDQKLDKDDLKKGIREVLKIQCSDDELSAFLDKLQAETDGSLDFSQFLVRFGLTFKSHGRWEYIKERKDDQLSKEKEEVKIFRRNMSASKWFGRGGIKAVLLRATTLGSMRGKWQKLKEKCEHAVQGKDTIKVDDLQEVMKGPNGIEPNFSDIQWRMFRNEYLSSSEERGFIQSNDDVLFRELCSELETRDRTCAFLGLKEFTSALRDGLGMSGLTSEDIRILSGSSSARPWWDRRSSLVDIDVFYGEFIQKDLRSDLILFRVLLVENVWIDIKSVMDSLNTSALASKTMITQSDFRSSFERLQAMGIVTNEDSEAILSKVKADNLYEKDGPNIGQIDYMKNFFLHYIPREIELHKIVYPHWEDCAEKFARFATTGEDALLDYRSFRELCRQFRFAQDLTSSQLETIIDVMDEDGDGDISLHEFKKRYARDEVKIREAVRQNWKEFETRLKTAKKPHNGRNRLDRSDFQNELLNCREELLPDVSAEQVVSLVVSLEPTFIAEKEVKWDLWLQKYAGDYFLIHQAFQVREQQTYKRKPWEVLTSCFEILQGSRSIEKMQMWSFLRSWEYTKARKDDQAGACPVCESEKCMWHKDFKSQDVVTWDEFRCVLDRAEIPLETRLLNRLLDDLDPYMHGFIHWRGFVEGRVPVFRRPASPDTKGKWVLGAPGAGPYFFNGLEEYKLRCLLVNAWNTVLIQCESEKKRKDEEEEKKSRANGKEFKPSPQGTIDAVGFKKCLVKALEKQQEPLMVSIGDETPSKPKLTDLRTAEKYATQADKVAQVAFTATVGKKFIDFYAFCENYSQGDFNAERYVRRKWENIYIQLKDKHDDEDDGYTTRAEARTALESPEMGLSPNMVEFLLNAYSDDPPEQDAEEKKVYEAEVWVNYVDLCWRFAKYNIQTVMFQKCITFFRHVRMSDKTGSMKMSKNKLHKFLCHPDVGLSQVESEIFLRKYEADGRKDGNKEPDEKIKLDYHFLLSGEWPDVKCNPKLYTAFRALEENWEKIADKVRASETVIDGMIHINDFRKLVLDLKKKGLEDKDAVEQAGRDLGLNARDELNLDEFMWKMSMEVLREKLAPSAPLLLKSFKTTLQRLKISFNHYRNEIYRKSETTGKGSGVFEMARNQYELKAMECAYNNDGLTFKYTEDIVRNHIKIIGVLQDHSGASEEVLGDISEAPHERSPIKGGGGGGGKVSSGDKANEKMISGMHVKILVERMDVGRDNKGTSAGFITEDSMLRVLQEFSLDQVFADDLELFQNSVMSIIRGTLQLAAEVWVDPDSLVACVDRTKAFSGVIVHSKGALTEIGRKPMPRAHMHAFFKNEASNMPPAMRASPQLEAIGKRREREVYHSNPWKTFWQESSRKVRAQTRTAVGPQGAQNVGGDGTKSQSEVDVAAAGQKVQRAFFTLFDNVESAFAKLDSSGKGVISVADLKRGLTDLKIPGLSSQEIDALVALETEIITFKEFAEKYGKNVESLATIAARRATSGVYSRLNKEILGIEGLRGEVSAEEEDLDRAAARAALGLEPPAGAQV